MQISVDLTEVAAKTMIEALLEAIKAKDEQILELEYDKSGHIWGLAMLSDFLIEKHPELTSELAGFIANKIEAKDDYEFGVADQAAANAIAGHIDVIENKEMDILHKKLHENQAKNNAIRAREKIMRNR